MQRLIPLVGIAVAVAATGIGCGESGPSGPDAKAIERFEDLGLSQSEAEAEVEAANREAAEQVRKDEARIQREIRKEEAHSAKHAPVRQQTPAQAAGFTGKYEEGFEIATFTCGNYPLKRIAKEFHLSPSANEFEVAEAYADGFYGVFAQAAFEGCMEGIRKRQTG